MVRLEQLRIIPFSKNKRRGIFPSHAVAQHLHRPGKKNEGGLPHTRTHTNTNTQRHNKKAGGFRHWRLTEKKNDSFSVVRAVTRHFSSNQQTSTVHSDAGSTSASGATPTAQAWTYPAAPDADIFFSLLLLRAARVCCQISRQSRRGATRHG